jgi:hypothetical protein
MKNENNVRHLSDSAFAHLGAEQVAYIKTAEIDDAKYFVLMSALGQELVAATSYDAVVAEAYERDLAVAMLN